MLKNIEYRSLKISFIIAGILTLIISLIPEIASANPVVAYSPAEDLGPNILFLFFANLMIDGLILMVPLLLLYKTGYEEKISELWIIGIPLIAIWGAYIDVIYIKIILTIESNLVHIMAIAIACGLIMIFVTFFIVLYVIMDQKLTTSINIGIIAVIINAIFWYLLTFDFTYYYNDFLFVLIYLGIFTLFALTIIMLRYLKKELTQHYYPTITSKPSSEPKHSFMKFYFSVIHIFTLLCLAFSMIAFYI